MYVLLISFSKRDHALTKNCTSFLNSIYNEIQMNHMNILLSVGVLLFSHSAEEKTCLPTALNNAKI